MEAFEEGSLARGRVSDGLRRLTPAGALPEGAHIFVARNKRNPAARCLVASPVFLSDVSAFHAEYAPPLRLLESLAGSASTCLRVLRPRCQPCADRRDGGRSLAGWFVGFLRSSKHKSRDPQSDSAIAAVWDRRARGTGDRAASCLVTLPCLEYTLYSS
jgi:hypothetical protein